MSSMALEASPQLLVRKARGWRFGRTLGWMANVPFLLFFYLALVSVAFESNDLANYASNYDLGWEGKFEPFWRLVFGALHEHLSFFDFVYVYAGAIAALLIVALKRPLAHLLFLPTFLFIYAGTLGMQMRFSLLMVLVAVAYDAIDSRKRLGYLIFTLGVGGLSLAMHQGSIYLPLLLLACLFVDQSVSLLFGTVVVVVSAFWVPQIPEWAYFGRYAEYYFEMMTSLGGMRVERSAVASLYGCAATILFAVLLWKVKSRAAHLLFLLNASALVFRGDIVVSGRLSNASWILEVPLLCGAVARDARRERRFYRWWLAAYFLVTVARLVGPEVLALAKQ